MVKKTYLVPELFVVQLSSRDAMMSVSAMSTLGVSSGGNTSTNSIYDADVKEQTITDVNVWDNEW